MAVPVILSDGENNVALSEGSIPVILGNITLVNGAIPVSANLEGTTVNAAFPETVNAAITNNITVNDVITTVNCRIVQNDADVFAQNDSGLFDAFGRQRVGMPVTLFQSMLTADNGSAYWDEQETGTANGTTSTWTQNEAAVKLTVNASVNTTRVRQTYERFAYQPGKSQQIFMTCVPGSAISGVTKEAGYGDEFDGLFCQTVGADVGFCRRTTVNGTTVDNFVAQADWNIDTLNGAGPSGYTLELTKTQILFMDFEWLGVGRARMGFVIDGKIIYCHAFNNTNNLSTVYMRTPVLPLRYKISGNGTQAQASTLTCICAAVSSEGGEQLIGRARSATSGTTDIAPPNTTNWTIIKALRLGSGGKSTTIRDWEVDIVNSDNNAVAEFAVIIDPTIAGGSLTWSAVTGSQMEQATGNQALYASAGTILHGGFIAGRVMETTGPGSRTSFGFSINGTSRVIALCARQVIGSPNIHGVFNWTES